MAAPWDIHPNLKLISFSSRRLLHNCPRKFELYRLVKKEIADEIESGGTARETVHLDFGSLVGLGCQLYMSGFTQKQVWIGMLRAFHGDLLYGVEDSKGRPLNKSFYHALHAVDQFSTLLQEETLAQYELVYYDVNYAPEPATELSFRIDLGDDFFFRGKLDALLRHKHNKRFAILEIKTTSSSNINEATYKNSEQGLGYSVIVDAIAHMMGETTGQPYDILYPVYQSKQMQWTIFDFPKTVVHRANWLQDIMMDVSLIQQYGNAGFFPMRGNNCYSFYRQCEYFDVCDMSKAVLFGPPDKIPLLKEIAADSNTYYDFKFTMDELIEAQRAKIAASTAIQGFK